MESHTLTINNTILTFTVARSKKRRRTIAIHVSHKKGVEVKVPYATKLEHIFELIQERSAWIQKRLVNLPNPEIQAIPWHERETLFYLGQAYTLKIETFPFAKKRAECQLQANTLQVTLAQGLTTSEQKKLIRKTLESWYRKQAEIVLHERTHYFAKLMQLTPRSIQIKTQKSRWGSCDSHNNLRYNWKIIMSASELIDYLVVHELAHIKVKNHSQKFWNLVASVLPDHQLRRKKLREFGRGIAEA